MTSVYQTLLRKVFGELEMRILIVGLDAAGKTTILYKLKLGEVVTTIPTIGFNVETVKYKNVSFTFWDVGGRDKIRPLWRHYYQNTQAVVCVVDSNDRERIDDTHGSDNSAKEELHRMMAEDELRDAVLCVMANKQDLPNALTVAQVTEKLALTSLRNRNWMIFGSCATTGEGLYEALDWLSTALTKRKKKVPRPTENSSNNNNNSSNSSNSDEDDSKTVLDVWLEREDNSDFAFLQSVTNATIPVWDHYNRVRLIWLMFTSYDRREGLNRIFSNIEEFYKLSVNNGNNNSNETNNCDIQIAKFYSVTICYFWAQMIYYALHSPSNIEVKAQLATDLKFFLMMNPEIINHELYKCYYTEAELFEDESSRSEMLLPKKKQLPSLIVTKKSKKTNTNANDANPSADPISELKQIAMNNQALNESDDYSFMHAFENRTLNKWNHEQFLRLVWAYITFYGQKKAVEKTMDAMKSFKKQGYHETETYFWIQMVRYYRALYLSAVVDVDDNNAQQQPKSPQFTLFGLSIGTKKTKKTKNTQNASNNSNNGEIAGNVNNEEIKMDDDNTEESNSNTNNITTDADNPDNPDNPHNNNGPLFKDFFELCCNKKWKIGGHKSGYDLMDVFLWKSFYSEKVMENKGFHGIDAAVQMVTPDIKPLPSLISRK